MFIRFNRVLGQRWLMWVVFANLFAQCPGSGKDNSHFNPLAIGNLCIGRCHTASYGTVDIGGSVHVSDRRYILNKSVQQWRAIFIYHERAQVSTQRRFQSDHHHGTPNRKIEFIFPRKEGNATKKSINATYSLSSGAWSNP